MQRLIPNKTKVRIELFRGVTVGDLIVCAIALVLLVFVVSSNLAWKWGIGIVIIGIAAFLLVRLDDQPNYLYLLHILSFLGYRRKFARTVTDQTLLGMEEKGETNALMDEMFEGDASAVRTEVPGKKNKSKNRKQEKTRQSGKKVKEQELSEEELQKRAWEKDAQIHRADMNEIMPFTGIADGYIEYLNGAYYGAVLEIDPVEFRFFSEHRRLNSIENCLGRIMRSLNPSFSANIVKLERPIMYDHSLTLEYDKLDGLRTSYENGALSEEELKARVEIEYDRINELISYTENNHVVTSFFYLVLFESDKRQLENQIRDAQQLLTNGEMKTKRLGDRELAVFLKYSNQIDFDERDVEKVRPEELHIWAQPDTVDIHPRRIEVNHIITHNFRVVNYPTIVDDAWLASLMSYPGTKVMVKFKPMERGKAIRNIDHSLTELRGQWSATGIDSRRMEIENHINTLQTLLVTLQNDAEVLLETNIYITAYDIMATRSNRHLPQPPISDLPNMSEMKKSIRRSWQESGFRLNNMEFEQVQAFIATQVSALDPLSKEGRGIASNTIAACYPWVFAHISDEGGIKLGETDGVPVFIDFFRRDSERVNSNMVIVGKSGSGKSYATKSLLANMAAEDAKIFILDPENEYTELAGNLHGQIINVGNALYGRLNPFHIITALDDDEAGDGNPSGSYATHLQFLEEFFKQIMPDCEKDAMEYLNTLVDHMYMNHNITPDTDLSTLSPEDYPIFDDLYDEVLQEFQNSDNVFTRDLLRSLMNYISKFSTGGRNANIWNGPSTITTDENFTVFNFQSMLANRNTTIANAQMLLVLKYIDNEIIKNRDFNLRYHANRKIVVVIDEAHVFIDSKFPIALDFMFQLAKRIRKYNGMQIVITQNIKDFVGSEELARKSTAIINACQYSFIFALAPNDMQDLIKLYENAGGINESEQEQIVQAPRGQAFTIMSPSSRSTFQVETAPGISELFEEGQYVSHYFTGEADDPVWEDFVGPSRPAHDRVMEEKLLRAPKQHEDSYSDGGVRFNVFEEDEYEDLMNAGKEQEEDSSSISFSVTEDIDEPQQEEEPAAESRPRLDQITLDRPGQLNTSDESMAVFGMIASALGRMADAAERGGQDLAAGIAAPAVSAPGARITSSEEQSEIREMLEQRDAEMARVRQQMEEEIRKLREENEQLREAAEEEKEENEDYLPEDDFGDEEDGDLSLLLDDDSDLDDDLELDEDESLLDEDEDEFGDDEDEFDLDDDDLDDEDFDEDEDDEDEDEDEDDDDDFMSSFCNFAASLMNMTAFERMRADGKETMIISLDDLTKEADAQLERRRKH